MKKVRGIFACVAYIFQMGFNWDWFHKMTKRKSHWDIGLPNKIIYKRESPKDWKISKVDEKALDDWLHNKIRMSK